MEHPHIFLSNKSLKEKKQKVIVVGDFKLYPVIAKDANPVWVQELKMISVKMM